MNEQQKKAAEYAEILLAFSRGEKCEFFSEYQKRWERVAYPEWSFSCIKYRIAPKPREWWVIPDENNNLLNANHINLTKPNDPRLVKVREVTE